MDENNNAGAPNDADAPAFIFGEPPVYDQSEADEFENYMQGDIVKSNDILYIVNVNNPTGLPGNSDNFTRFGGDNQQPTGSNYSFSVNPGYLAAGDGQVVSNNQAVYFATRTPDKLKVTIEPSDPAGALSASVRGQLMSISMPLAAQVQERQEWHRVYIKGLAKMDPGTKYYPDANFSMRLTYGQVLPYDPRDGVVYKYYTTLKGVLEKEDPSNPLEFTVPDGIKTAYAASDYGRYGQDGELRLNFLSNNDITGGNSGSPVLNARGELIGLAFDGNWEAMSGDVMFEPSLQRCINVDIRYVLFLIDKFAGATHLIDEMTIVE